MARAHEVAEITGASVPTVRTRLFYARRQLARLVSAEPALEEFSREFGP
jgi:DNA-directed RNA polymerase specialized sigma24 family protein